MPATANFLRRNVVDSGYLEISGWIERLNRLFGWRNLSGTRRNRKIIEDPEISGMTDEVYPAFREIIPSAV